MIVETVKFFNAAKGFGFIKPDLEIKAEHTKRVPAFKLTQAEIRKLVEEIIG